MEQVNDKNAQAEIADALTDPVGYALVRLNRQTLYDWQVNVLDSLREPGRVALKTCNESGKTSEIIADIILWHLENFKNGLVVTTSGSYLQITGQLYPALRARSSGIQGIRIGKDWATCEHTKGRLVSFSTDDSGRAEGWHEQSGAVYSGNPLAEWGVSNEDWERAEHGNSSLMIIIDEAKSPPDGIWDAFERCHPTRWLVASSTGGSLGRFYDCFHSDKERWQQFTVKVTDCPHLWDVKTRRAEIEQQMKHLPKPLTDSMFWAEFSDLGENALFNAAKIDLAMSGLLPKWGQGMMRAGMDLSGGGDGAPLYVADGNEISLVREWNERDHEKLTREVIAELNRRRIRPEQVNVDNGGLGQPIITHFQNQRWDVCRVDFGGKAKQDKWYENMRAEMYSRLADLVNREAVRLPKDEELKKQLLWQVYEPGYKKLKLIPKKQMPYSPNRADALVLAVLDLPDPGEFADALGNARRRTERTEGVTGRFSMLADDDDNEPGSGLFIH